MHLLAKETSGYNEIEIYETTELFGETGKFRVLQFGRNAIQGAIDLRDPGRIVFEYPRAMLAWMHARHPSFRDVFVIGHGIGTLAAHCPDKRVKTAEIDSLVVALSRTYFGCSPDHVAVGDGRRLLALEARHSCDFIVVDAFTASGTPMRLQSLEFFAMAKEKLRPQGALLLNLAGRGRHDKLVSAAYATLRETFPHTEAYSLPARHADDIRNYLLIGSCAEPGRPPRDMAGFRRTDPEPGHINRDRRTDRRGGGPAFPD